MRGKRPGILGLVVLFLTALASLPAGAQQRADHVRLGMAGISGTNAPPYIGYKLGLFAKYGIDLEPIYFQGGTTLNQAVTAGDVQLELIAAGPVLSADAAGADLIFLQGMVNTFPYVIVSRQSISRPAQLKGGKVGISRFGSSSDEAMRMSLHKMGLVPEKDVAILQVGGQSTRFAALQSGAVDATIVSPPFNLVAEEQGYRVLFDVAASGIEYPHQQLVGRRDYVQKHRGIVLRFLKGFNESLGLWKKPGNEKTILRMLSAFLKLDPVKHRRELEETFRYYGKVFPALPYPPLKGIRDAQTALAERNPKVRRLQVENYVDDSFVKSLQESGFLGQVY